MTLTFGADTTRVQPVTPKRDRPLVAVAGDSYVMGWGVNDAETFSAILASKYGWRTVNSGVSGYGAPRELIRLRKLGLLSRCDALIIDFANKDPRENRAFLEDPKGFIAKRDAAQLWKGMQGYHQQDVTLAGILGFTCRDVADQLREGGLGGVWRSFRESNDPYGRIVPLPFPDSEVARDFLQVFDHFPELRGKPVFVVEIDDYGCRTGVTAELQRLAAERPDLHPVSLAYRRSDFFRFDNHLSPEGHRHVAEVLNAAIEPVLSPVTP